MQTLERPAAADWITVPEAARRLGCGMRAMRRLVEDGLVTSRQFPGSYPQVLAADVELVAKEVTRPRSKAATN